MPPRMGGRWTLLDQGAGPALKKVLYQAYSAAQVLRAAAGLRPTVIVIEDAHWADEATLSFLSTAHDLLQERAAKITDEEMRRSFLENVAAHREIVSEFAESE